MRTDRRGFVGGVLSLLLLPKLAPMLAEECITAWDMFYLYEPPIWDPSLYEDGADELTRRAYED